MEISNMGIAGTLESSDIFISIEQNKGRGIEIELKSTVERQFGKQIKNVIRSTLEEMGVTEALVRANDKGALDCTIKARVITAVNRVIDTAIKPWEVK